MLISRLSLRCTACSSQKPNQNSHQCLEMTDRVISDWRTLIWNESGWCGQATCPVLSVSCKLFDEKVAERQTKLNLKLNSEWFSQNKLIFIGFVTVMVWGIWITDRGACWETAQWSVGKLRGTLTGLTSPVKIRRRKWKRTTTNLERGLRWRTQKRWHTHPDSDRSPTQRWKSWKWTTDWS